MGRALIVLLLAGCGADPGTPDAGDAEVLGCGAGRGQVEVGRGGSRAMALPREGGQLPIVLGAQGGIHVVVAAWVWDMDLDLELRLRLEEDGARVGLETVQELRPGLFGPDGARYLRHPDLVVLDNDAPSVETYAGREVVLIAEARSADGSHACDARTVTLLAPP